MDFLTVDEDTQKREREKARELRAGAWWKNQLGTGRCYYCERSIPPTELTMDHKTPIARGGRSTKGNLVPCCKECNNEKAYMVLSEWIAKRQEEGRPLACARHELY
jgi:5-methylcytosine-specific restriction endonuclease McrA